MTAKFTQNIFFVNLQMYFSFSCKPLVQCGIKINVQNVYYVE